MAFAETRLDRLNALLKATDFGLPAFRTNVSASGSNLAWLRKTLGRRNDVSAELLQLLSFDTAALHKQHVPLVLEATESTGCHAVQLETDHDALLNAAQEVSPRKGEELIESLQGMPVIPQATKLWPRTKSA